MEGEDVRGCKETVSESGGGVSTRAHTVSTGIWWKVSFASRSKLDDSVGQEGRYTLSGG